MVRRFTAIIMRAEILYQPYGLPVVALWHLSSGRKWAFCAHCPFFTSPVLRTMRIHFTSQNVLNWMFLDFLLLNKSLLIL